MAYHAKVSTLSGFFFWGPGWRIDVQAKVFRRKTLAWTVDLIDGPFLKWKMKNEKWKMKNEKWKILRCLSKAVYFRPRWRIDVQAKVFRRKTLAWTVDLIEGLLIKASKSTSGTHPIVHFSFFSFHFSFFILHFFPARLANWCSG